MRCHELEWQVRASDFSFKFKIENIGVFFSPQMTNNTSWRQLWKKWPLIKGIQPVSIIHNMISNYICLQITNTVRQWSEKAHTSQQLLLISASAYCHGSYTMRKYISVKNGSSGLVDAITWVELERNMHLWIPYIWVKFSLWRENYFCLFSILCRESY